MKIKEIITKANLGSLQSYTWLGNGFSSNAYQINTSTDTYVLLETKKNAVEHTNYKTYFANLKCLEKSNYAHAPKAVYVTDDGRSLVVTKVPGVVISKLQNLSPEEHKTLALKLTDTLLALCSIQPSTLAAELAAFNIDLPEPFSPKQDWKKYVIDTFYPYKVAAPQDAQTEWLEQQITSYEIPTIEKEEAIFRHGDTSEPNILVDEQHNIYLIDWGSSRFYASSKAKEDFGLAYTMNHVKVMQEFKEEVLQYAAQQGNVAYEDLQAIVFQKQKEIKIADIAWAYMMYARATAGEVSDPPQTFKQILDQRIEEYKVEFQ